MGHHTHVVQLAERIALRSRRFLGSGCQHDKSMNELLEVAVLDQLELEVAAGTEPEVVADSRAVSVTYATDDVDDEVEGGDVSPPPSLASATATNVLLRLPQRHCGVGLAAGSLAAGRAR